MLQTVCAAVKIAVPLCGTLVPFWDLICTTTLAIFAPTVVFTGCVVNTSWYAADCGAAETVGVKRMPDSNKAAVVITADRLGWTGNLRFIIAQVPL